jgi:TM2 domain-containing membrane protein YozV
LPFCPNCGRAVNAADAFCPSCGYNLKAVSIPKPQPAVPLEHKSPGIAAVLALVPGFFGLMGIGHIYVGRLGRGIALLIVGIILGFLSWGSFILGFVTFGITFIFWIIFAIILFILWIWQTYDAYNLAKQFNRIVEETGRPPW